MDEGEACFTGPFTGRQCVFQEKSGMAQAEWHKNFIGWE